MRVIDFDIEFEIIKQIPNFTELAKEVINEINDFKILNR